MMDLRLIRCVDMVLKDRWAGAADFCLDASSAVCCSDCVVLVVFLECGPGRLGRVKYWLHTLDMGMGL